MGIRTPLGVVSLAVRVSLEAYFSYLVPKSLWPGRHFSPMQYR
jgi:hypothetical protein